MGRALINAKYPGDWSIRDEKLYKGETAFNQNFSVVDAIGELAGDTVTIFQGDTRIATNVKKPDGNRAIGTQVAENVKEATLKKGETYLGKVLVVNVWAGRFRPFDPICPGDPGDPFDGQSDSTGD